VQNLHVRQAGRSLLLRILQDVLGMPKPLSEPPGSVRMLREKGEKEMSESNLVVLPDMQAVENTEVE
jgi:hypothetical protein